MFHVAEGAGPHDGGSEGGLEGDFLVDAPFEIDSGFAMEASEGVPDFRCRCAGVSRDKPDSGLEGAPGYRFVAEDA